MDLNYGNGNNFINFQKKNTGMRMNIEREQRTNGISNERMKYLNMENRHLTTCIFLYNYFLYRFS